MNAPDGQEWIVGASIADDERIEAIERVLEESLRTYLREKTRPGKVEAVLDDSMWFWRFDEPLSR